jgi:RNA polymerase sigma factor (sigma-70 family)
VSPRVSDLFLRSQSDERLVSLARAGHVRAFSVIVERYGPELAALARRLSPDGRGEDILQQAFLSAFVALQRGSEVRHLRGWLYQIVRNVSAREPRAMSAPLESAMAAADTVEDVVLRRALARSTLSELAQLPARQREAMVGTAVDGRARGEVARAMGLSEGAVRQLVHRARTTLRSAITAVTPWPLARWLDAARAGALPSGGVAMKLGALVASGTLATGIATVAIHVDGSHRPPARAVGAGHARLGVRIAHDSIAMRSVTVATAPGAFQGLPAAAVRTAEVSLPRVVSQGHVKSRARASNGWRGDHRAGSGSSGRDGRSGVGQRDGRHDQQAAGGGGQDAQGGGGGRDMQGRGGGQDTHSGGGWPGAQTGGGWPGAQTADTGQRAQAGADRSGAATDQVAFAANVPRYATGSDHGGDGQPWVRSSQPGGRSSHSWAGSSQPWAGSSQPGGGSGSGPGD